jgi:peptidoglycan/LPS O-acetylase OafA/YrhL
MTEGAVHPEHRRRVPGLDGLRGLAVVAVVAYHLHLLRGGFLGVDVFFVLSGYLVTSLLLDEAEGPGDGRVHLGRFWLRRARRLVPALLVLVPVVVTAAVAFDWPRDRFGALAGDAFATLTWWANWRQAGGVSYWAGTQNLFRHAWSLSIEEQFYLAWPLLVVASAWVARRLGRSVRVAVGVTATVGFTVSSAWLLVLAQRLADTDLSRAYVGTDTRVLAPLAGCALACWWRGGEPRTPVGRAVTSAAGGVALIGLGTAMATTRVTDPSLYRRGGFVLVALAAVVALVASSLPPSGRAVDPSDPLGAVVRTSVLRWLGLRSYGIYLWSWPTQVLVEHRWPDLGRGGVALVTVAVALSAAELSYRFVEDPVRRSRGWARRPVARRPAWAFGVAVPIVALLLVDGHAVAPPLHERIDTVESARDALRPPPTTVPGTTAPLGEPAPLRVMVAGDSVAWTVAYYAPNEAILPPGIASIDSRALIGCGLLSSEGWKYPAVEPDAGFGAPAGDACGGQVEAERLGLAGRPDVVLLFPGGWEWTPAQAPDGHVVDAQSPEMRGILLDRLVGKARKADAVGAELVLAEWSCPGSKVTDGRADPAYIRWINALLREAVRRAIVEGLDARVLVPTDEVCVDADPAGEPTPAKVEATGDEVHVVADPGGHWIWQEWLAPALLAGR